MNINIILKNNNRCDGCPCLDGEYGECQLLPNRPKIELAGWDDDKNPLYYPRPLECIKKYGK